MVLRQQTVACKLSTSPALSLWTRPEAATVSLSYDGATHNHTFQGGGLLLSASPAPHPGSGQLGEVVLELALKGTVDSALSGDIGSPAAWVWWLSDQFTDRASPRVDDFFVGEIDGLARGPDGAVATLTIAHPGQWKSTHSPQMWSHQAQQARFAGDTGFEWIARLAEAGLPPIGEGQIGQE